MPTDSNATFTHRNAAYKTLEQFILEQRHRFVKSTGSFSRLIRDLSIAAKVVNSYIRRAGLLDISGASGDINVQGEVQQKLDLIAHAEFIEALKLGGECGLVVSEEQDEAIPVDTREEDTGGQYIVLLDPLDGSSNIDVNVSVGTIFSIYRRSDLSREPTMEDALQPGRDQVAAGYIVYGSSTMLVYTAGDGVNGFTLDPAVGEFMLSHPNIRTPDTGRFYTIDEGNSAGFAKGLQSYLHWIKYEQETPQAFKTRYVGSFIADFHRNLLKGGLYMYPRSDAYPEGKLRLMYEANPMALIVEQAGGLASNGTTRILDLQPKSLHERAPLFIGSRGMVEQVRAYLHAHAHAGS